MTPEGGSSTDATLTKFHVFEVSDDMMTLSYRGEQVARDRAQALNLFYPDKDAAAPQRTAISENALRIEPARAARPVFPPTGSPPEAPEEITEP